MSLPYECLCKPVSIGGKFERAGEGDETATKKELLLYKLSVARSRLFFCEIPGVKSVIAKTPMANAVCFESYWI